MIKERSLSKLHALQQPRVSKKRDPAAPGPEVVLGTWQSTWGGPLAGAVAFHSAILVPTEEMTTASLSSQQDAGGKEACEYAPRRLV